MSNKTEPAAYEPLSSITASRRRLVLGLPVIAAAAGACTPTPRAVSADDRENGGGENTHVAWHDSEHIRRFYEIARF